MLYYCFLVLLPLWIVVLMYCHIVVMLYCCFVMLSSLCIVCWCIVVLLWCYIGVWLCCGLSLKNNTVYDIVGSVGGLHVGGLQRIYISVILYPAEHSPLSSIHHPPSPPISYTTNINSERNDTLSVAETLLACLNEKQLHRIGSMVLIACRAESIWFFSIHFFCFPIRINSLSIQNYCCWYYMALPSSKIGSTWCIELDLHV